MVLVLIEEKWVFLVGAITPLESPKNGEATAHYYGNAILREDYLDTNEVRCFYEELGQRFFMLEDKKVIFELSSNQGGYTHYFRNNNYMKRSGDVYETNVNNRNILPSEPLINSDSPFFPDVYEAAAYWLDISVYNRSSDSRNWSLMLILPECRAGLFDVRKFGEELSLKVEQDPSHPELVIKCIYWSGGKIHHLEPTIIGGACSLNFPSGTGRVELALIRERNELIDLIRIENFEAGIGEFDHVNLGHASLSRKVGEARMLGEGPRLEFKPFISPKDAYKYTELLETVAAFSNSAGGSAYIGIRDDGALSGINDPSEGESRFFGSYYKCSLDKESCCKYSDDIKRLINDKLVNHAEEITYEFANIAEVYILIIDVPESTNKPVHIKDQRDIFVRRGANNIRLYPHEYGSYICDHGRPASELSMF
ncbi:hypothetical protein BI364_15735 [Acidihalobacter yilgarnensis]|uniref:Schlafen AlbA-2 domain-containing protein n=2 Tax=Acidihalobacter yilgarnensis TaxID=2819280 RepID=A0A1D8IRS0_9GAMM|nr:hypothetical protein BI364_15735 [Acidihalobacter yilgarnensis]